MAVDTAKFGVPVEIGQIGKALKKLWEGTEGADDGATTRASLLNFAIYCEGAEAGDRNNDFIREFTQDHACRAILIIAEPRAAETKIQAWVNAHCHQAGASAKQICCEQITFLLEGTASKLIPNIVFSNLDSDLPLVLWWQADFPIRIDGQLLAWVDRLVFDSYKWAQPVRQLTRLLEWLNRSQSRLAMCDLNWTRSLHLRQALAQMFDHPENRQILDGMTKVTICHGPEFRSTALLLTGWFAAQLNLDLNRCDGDLLVLTNTEGREIDFDLAASGTRSIGCCEITAPQGSVKVARDAGGSFFEVDVHLADGRTYHHLLPAGNNRSTSLLAEELSLGGRHRVYIKALAVAKELL
jgi:glucose-6-phosphate dehydrogenase assembly protein OpcA